MQWICGAEKTSDATECPLNCMAWNRLPYETVEFEAKNFPPDTWEVVPCNKHEKLFTSYPDVVRG
jgi:hypothetical protein